MNNREKRVYLETKLRNLERTYQKFHTRKDMIEYCIELKADIDNIKRELEYGV